MRASLYSLFSLSPASPLPLSSFGRAPVPSSTLGCLSIHRPLSLSASKGPRFSCEKLARTSSCALLSCGRLFCPNPVNLAHDSGLSLLLEAQNGRTSGLSRSTAFLSCSHDARDSKKSARIRHDGIAKGPVRRGANPQKMVWDLRHDIFSDPPGPFSRPCLPSKNTIQWTCPYSVKHHSTRVLSLGSSCPQ